MMCWVDSPTFQWPLMNIISFLVTLQYRLNKEFPEAEGFYSSSLGRQPLHIREAFIEHCVISTDLQSCKGGHTQLG